MEKCVWCNKTGKTLEEIEINLPDRFGLNICSKKMMVHSEHKRHVYNFYKKAVKYSKLYIIGVILIMIICILGLIPIFLIESGGGNVDFWSKIIFGIPLLSVSVLPIIFPFATPETIKWLGIHKSIIIVRLLGVGMMTVLLLWMFFY